MPLLHLPNEIIERILHHVGNADLDCYTASCWSLRALSRKRLRQHAKRKAEKLEMWYNDDTMGIRSTKGVTYETQEVHPARLIQKLLQDDAFPYVQDLVMTFAPPDERAEMDSVAFHSRRYYRIKRTKQFQCIKTGLHNAGVFLDKQYNIDRLTGRLLDNDHEAPVPIMLSLAKRLRTVRFNNLNSIPHDVMDLLQVIAHQARGSNAPEKPLSRLAHVLVQSDYHEDPFDLGPMEPFLRLPSIYSLDLDVGQISPWVGPDSLDFKSSLSSLHLSGYFKLRALKQLLGNISNLREFCCEYRTYVEGYETSYKPYRGPHHENKRPFNPRLIRDWLLRFARHSLQHLTICHLCNYEYTTSSVGSLEGFESLETVALGSDMFDGTDHKERANETSTHSPYEFLHILPCTIRRITILEPDVHYRRIFDALDHVTRYKRDNLFELTDIDFRGASYIWAIRQLSKEFSTHMETLKDVGIDLTIDSVSSG